MVEKIFEATPTARKINELIDAATDALARLDAILGAGVSSAAGLGVSTYRKRFVAFKGLADNVATSVATITTTNEAGDVDAGTYAVRAHLLIADTNALGTTGSTAAKSMTIEFARAIENTGATGVTSAVSEVVETASAATNAAVRDIGAVTVTVTETSEYVVNIQVQADHTGTGASVLVCVMEIDLLWYGFLTAPVVANA